jgi:endonuclease YncB( thermonuclease family)
MRCLLIVASLLTSAASLAGYALAQTQDGERKIRNVTPEGIPIIILPPRKDDRAPQANEPAIPGDLRTAMAQPDGTFLIGNEPVSLIGVVALPSDTLCMNGDGGKWACGLRAHVAIRQFLHAKELKCETLTSAKSGRVFRCYRDRTNVSQWLLEQGWALPDAQRSEDNLNSAADEARAQKRGIWAGDSKVLQNAAQ